VIILGDQDGVLADYDNGFDEHWADLYPDWIQPPVSQRDVFYIEDGFPADRQPFVGPIQRTEGFFLNLKPIPGAIDGMRELLAAGHDVRICTAPLRDYEHCIKEKYQWVEKHLGLDWCARIMPTRDKTLVVGDALIDDRPDITGVIRPFWNHVVYDQSYNRTLTTSPRITWGNHMDVLTEVEDYRARNGLLIPRL
jgi:5'-nucleotidase